MQAWVVIAWLALVLTGWEWGRAGRWTAAHRYGNRAEWVVQRVRGSLLGVGVVCFAVAMGWLGHVSQWGNCMAANGCEVYFFAMFPLLALGIPVYSWLASVWAGLGRGDPTRAESAGCQWWSVVGLTGLAVLPLPLCLALLRTWLW